MGAGPYIGTRDAKIPIPRRNTLVRLFGIQSGNVILDPGKEFSAQVPSPGQPCMLVNLLSKDFRAGISVEGFWT